MSVNLERESKWNRWQDAEFKLQRLETKIELTATNQPQNETTERNE
jgi:hypothetical protein